MPDNLKQFVAGALSPEQELTATEAAAVQPGVEPTAERPSEPLSIEKPQDSGLDRFKIANTGFGVGAVETLITGLPHYKMSEAKDWVRLHPDETNYWSAVMAFVNVPIQGQRKDTLHLIIPDLASRLQRDIVQFLCLALATKPYDVFFLCHVPVRNLDNIWNSSNLDGCKQAKKFWTMAVSMKDKSAEGYHIMKSTSETEGRGPPFPHPNWPADPLDKLIRATFEGRMITEATDPAWLRLVGDAQKLS